MRRSTTPFAKNNQVAARWPVENRRVGREGAARGPRARADSPGLSKPALRRRSLRTHLKRLGRERITGRREHWSHTSRPQTRTPEPMCTRTGVLGLNLEAGTTLTGSGEPFSCDRPRTNQVRQLNLRGFASRRNRGNQTCRQLYKKRHPDKKGPVEGRTSRGAGHPRENRRLPACRGT